MSYAIVEFSDRSVSTVLDKWFTPEKSQVYWPPYKDSFQFNRALTKKEEANESTWALYPVNRCLHRTDNLEKALRKQKEAEETSNLDTSEDDEDNEFSYSRKRYRPLRFCDSEEIGLPKHKRQPSNLKAVPLSESDDEGNQPPKLKRPPSLNLRSFVKTRQPEGESIELTEVVSVPKPSITQIFGNNSKPSTSNQNNYSAAQLHPQSRVSGVNHVTDANILPILIRIREQNNQILSILRQQNIFAENVPNFHKLPLNSEEDITELENDLSTDNEKSVLLVNHLSSLGGDGVVTKTNKILRELLTDSLASKFNFKGRQKNAFNKLKLKDIIIQVVKSKIKSTTNVEIENAIKTWLKHAPQRKKLSAIKSLRDENNVNDMI